MSASLFPELDQASDSPAVRYSLPEVRAVCVREEAASLPSSQLNRPELVRDAFAALAANSIWYDSEKECFLVFLVDRKNRAKGVNLVSLGGLSEAHAHPREVFRAAVAHAAGAVICVHNHPSGDPAPSAADIHVTRQLAEAGKVLGIDVLDHVIIGRPAADPVGKGFYSFREAGML